jgi:hypothetical protein
MKYYGSSQFLLFIILPITLLQKNYSLLLSFTRYLKRVSCLKQTNLDSFRSTNRFSNIFEDISLYTIPFVKQKADHEPLLRNEYELTFHHSPDIHQLASNGLWPSRQLVEWEEINYKKSIQQKGKITIEDVNNASMRFRKTILGLEKYRINNPGAMSLKYCDFISICLEINDTWGVAANALEYAGF